MTDLAHIRDLAGRDHGLAVVAVPRDDGTVGATVVNAGVMATPLTVPTWSASSPVPRRGASSGYAPGVRSP